jgi:hypothetical protein
MNAAVASQQSVGICVCDTRSRLPSTGVVFVGVALGVSVGGRAKHAGERHELICLKFILVYVPCAYFN